MIGQILGGRYELKEIIGDGGMSTVYKAHCRVLDRIVAVKVLRSEFSRDAGFVERFNIEAQAVGKINHPNIVNIFDVGQDGNVHYIVMEYVEGKCLKDLIVEQGQHSGGNSSGYYGDGAGRSASCPRKRYNPPGYQASEYSHYQYWNGLK